MMITTHNLGIGRIGNKRQLKFALEAYWRGESSQAQLLDTAAALRAQHWQWQQGLDLLPVGDFSLYDQVLDKLMQRAASLIPAKRLWVNPDCGLKTRQWHEVIPALQNMVQAAKSLRSA